MSARAERLPTIEQPKEDTRDVQLTLSYDVARMLRSVCQSVGGSPSGPRGKIDQISFALVTAGVLPANVAKSGSVSLD